MNNKKLVILGASGHAKSIIDSIEQNAEYIIAGVVNVENTSQKFESYNILGDDSRLQSLFDSGIKHAIIAIGYMGKSTIREELYKRLKEIGYSLPVIIDKSAIISEDVVIGEGSFVGKGAIINRDVSIGKMSIINSGSIVEHEDIIGEFTHIAVGAVLCGGVKIGNRVLIGANATIIQEIQVDDDVIVGAGTTVTSNIEKNKVVIGQTVKDKVI